MSNKVPIALSPLDAAILRGLADPEKREITLDERKLLSAIANAIDNTCEYVATPGTAGVCPFCGKSFLLAFEDCACTRRGNDE